MGRPTEVFFNYFCRQHSKALCNARVSFGQNSAMARAIRFRFVRVFESRAPDRRSRPNLNRIPRPRCGRSHGRSL